MAAIVKHVQRVNTAKTFLHNYVDASSSIYVGIGKGGVIGDPGEQTWADELNPDATVDTKQAEIDFWTNRLAAIKVNPGDTSMVVPRINWEAGQVYQIFDVNSATAFQEPFYVKTTGQNVYQCVGSTGSVTVTEPTGTGDSIDTQDGHTWKFLYSLDANDVENILTENWMPVYYVDNEDTKTFTVNSSLTTAELPFILGANHVMIRAFVPKADDIIALNLPGGADKIPSNISYRQTAVLLDPRDSLDVICSNAFYDADDLKTTLDYGVLIQLDNRRAIYRDPNQTETIINVVAF